MMSSKYTIAYCHLAADTVMRDSNVPSLPDITISSARLAEVSVQSPRSSRNMPRKSQPQAVRRSPRLRARAAASAVPTAAPVTPGPSTVDPEPARPGATGVSADPAVTSISSRRRQTRSAPAPTSPDITPMDLVDSSPEITPAPAPTPAASHSIPRASGPRTSAAPLHNPAPTPQEPADMATDDPRDERIYCDALDESFPAPSLFDDLDPLAESAAGHFAEAPWFRRDVCMHHRWILERYVDEDGILPGGIPLAGTHKWTWLHQFTYRPQDLHITSDRTRRGVVGEMALNIHAAIDRFFTYDVPEDDADTDMFLYRTRGERESTCRTFLR